MTSSSKRWHEPSEGFMIADQERRFAKREQVERLTAIGVDPERYQEQIDPAFLIGLSIDAGIDAGISAEGNVNMLTSLCQQAPIRLNEPFVVSGMIESVQQVPRGARIQTRVEFRSLTDAPLATVRRESLKPDPSSTAARGAGSRPAPVIGNLAELNRVASYQLTPGATWAYSHEGNAIHYEVPAAEQAGFRAPIIGGGQGVHYLTAALWDEGYKALDVDIYFRRPIFWDQTVWVGKTDDWSAIALVRDDKIGTEVRVNGVRSELR